MNVVPLHQHAAAEAEAIQTYFEGDCGLFAEFRDACVEQFPEDIRAGDAALAAGDGQTLRHVAHSQKSVLMTLGRPALAQVAATLEALSQRGDLAACAEHWAQLRAGLNGYCEPG